MRFYLLMGLALSVAFPALAQKPPQGEKKPQPVIVKEAKKNNFADRIEALGTLRANETVAVTATVTEPITAINFDDGQRVKAGDILIEMMSKQEDSELKAAKATLDEARRQVERIAPLVKDGAASKSILDQRQREYDTAKAALDGVKSRISDRIITAPFDGVLGLRNISVGAVLQPGTKITNLDDDSVMKLDFSVPSVFIEALKIGLEIEAKSNSFADKTFKGKITSIDSQIDATTRSITVRAILPNDEHLLKPGLLMSVEILKNPRQTIILPEEGVVAIGRTNHVFVVENTDGKLIAKKREVKLGERRLGDVEILEGIKEGEKIITHGTLNVKDGAEVSIRAEQTGAETIPELIKEKTSEKPVQGK